LLESKSQAALDALAGVDRRLDRHLLGGPLACDSSGAYVQIFIVLADDQHVDVGWALAPDRRLHALIELHRPEIDILLKIEPKPQQDTLLEDSRRHARVPYRTQENGVAAPQTILDRVGQDLSCRQEPFAAQVESLELELNGDQPGYVVKNGQSLRDHFGTDSVSWDDADSVQTYLPPRWFVLVWIFLI
jgi:hypothetical protein